MMALKASKVLLGLDHKVLLAQMAHKEQRVTMAHRAQLAQD
jgi:hypothetical protein